VNYAKLLEMNFFFTWHTFLQVGKTQDSPSKIWQTIGDALVGHEGMQLRTAAGRRRTMPGFRPCTPREPRPAGDER
jgi:hypothetical protein